MIALYLLTFAIVVTWISFTVFTLYDIKVNWDHRVETETASTVIRRWMKQSKAHLFALTGAILGFFFLASSVTIFLLGHFPFGIW